MPAFAFSSRAPHLATSSPELGLIDAPLTQFHKSIFTLQCSSFIVFCVLQINPSWCVRNHCVTLWLRAGTGLPDTTRTQVSFGRHGVSRLEVLSKNSCIYSPGPIICKQSELKRRKYFTVFINILNAREWKILVRVDTGSLRVDAVTRDTPVP